MKCVLLSIKPEWCNYIKSGSKTIEVRKSMPKLPFPFKVYIYMTKDGNETGGAVIGEFVCDYVTKYSIYDRLDYSITESELSNTCIPYDDFKAYGNGETLYGWHISMLKIYPESKPLNNFYKYSYLNAKFNSIWYVDDNLWQVSRPPQSYMFVEDLDDIEKIYSDKVKAEADEVIKSEISKAAANNSLIAEYESIKDPAERLNYFRNLHYKDNSDSESFIIAWALDEILPELTRLRKEHKHGK